MDLRAQGERWFADPRSFQEQMPELWGQWGCASEIGTLKAALVRRPGREIEGMRRPEDARFRTLMDPDLAREQHDRLCDLYRSHQVQVHTIDRAAPDRPNAMYVRDLVAMTPEGAIICRPAMEARRGEERYAAAVLAGLGVPILRTIAGTGTFEGADLLWASPDLAFLGIGNRTNPEGARQVEAELKRMGIAEIVHVQVPYGSAHLDGFMSFADRELAVVFPWSTPFIVVEALKRHNFRVLEAANIREAKETLALNFVALAPGQIVAAAENSETNRQLRDHGVEVTEIPMGELLKGWGSMHCLTAFLHRDGH